MLTTGSPPGNISRPLGPSHSQPRPPLAALQQWSRDHYRPGSCGLAGLPRKPKQSHSGNTCPCPVGLVEV
jgi:hypothetical protein